MTHRTRFLIYAMIPPIPLIKWLVDRRVRVARPRKTDWRAKDEILGVRK
jgi:hypothetical protein